MYVKVASSNYTNLYSTITTRVTNKNNYLMANG